jgi:hypothetical protein
MDRVMDWEGNGSDAERRPDVSAWVEACGNQYAVGRARRDSINARRFDESHGNAAFMLTQFWQRYEHMFFSYLDAEGFDSKHLAEIDSQERCCLLDGVHRFYCEWGYLRLRSFLISGDISIPDENSEVLLERILRIAAVNFRLRFDPELDASSQLLLPVSILIDSAADHGLLRDFDQLVQPIEYHECKDWSAKRPSGDYRVQAA